MKQSLYIGKEPNLQKIVIVSTLLHLLFIILVAIPIKTKEKEYKSYFVNLVGPVEFQKTPKASTIKKSEEGVKKTVKLKPAPRKRVAPKKGVSLEPAEPAERVSREIDRLRAISTLSKLKKEKEEEKAHEIDAIRQKIRGSVSISMVTPGDQPLANANAYVALIREKIWSEWIYPDLNSSGLEVIISFMIDKEGKVTSPKIVESSGNNLYDYSAVKAILKASPLPPPAVEEEVEIRFRL